MLLSYSIRRVYKERYAAVQIRKVHLTDWCLGSPKMKDHSFLSKEISDNKSQI